MECESCLWWDGEFASEVLSLSGRIQNNVVSLNLVVRVNI